MIYLIYLQIDHQVPHLPLFEVVPDLHNTYPAQSYVEHAAFLRALPGNVSYE